MAPLTLRGSARLLPLIPALLAAPATVQAQQDGWSVIVGARAGFYAPSAALLSRTYEHGPVEAEIGFSPQVSFEAGLATGSPATVVRLVVGHAPSMDLDLWRRACGRGPVCTLGTAEGGITTVTAELSAPFASPLREWDMAFIGGVGAKRYGWSPPDPGCGQGEATAAECESARELARARSVFTVHVGIEATYPLGRHSLVVEVGDYLSGFGLRTEGAARGQFQNDIVGGLGLRVRPRM